MKKNVSDEAEEQKKKLFVGGERNKEPIFI
jgi:hypothetical protein